MGADGGGGGAPGGAPGAQMVLYQHPPAWGLPTSCPRCLAAQVLLRFAAGAGLGGAGGAQESDAFAAFSFETDSGGNASLSPTGSLPALEDGEAFVGGYGGVREHVRSARSADVDAWMPAAAAAQRAAFEALVENRLAPATEAALWARRENYRAVSKPAYAAAHAWPLGSILALQRRRAALAALPHGSTEESLTSAAVEAVGNLAAFLDDKRYLFGAHPTSLDATVLGQLLLHMWAPLPHHPLRDAIGARPNLVAYARRCAQECFGALEPPLVGEDGVIGGAGARPKLAKERKKVRTRASGRQIVRYCARLGGAASRTR